jgi:tRNA (guanosine-2'-O-)-methyltransferase
MIPKHKKWGYRSSSSAAKWLTIHQFTDTKECFDALREKFDKIYTTHLSSNAVGLYELDFNQRVALVFGNEHGGLSEETIALSDGNFIIPQVGIIKSLNISVACAVSVYEAFRQKNIAGHYQQRQLEDPVHQTLRTEWGFIEDEL